MNFLQLRVRLGRRLGITRAEAENPEEWEMMGEALNEGVIDILSRTRLHVKCLVLQTIPGETEYELDDEILRLYNMRDEDVGADMDQRDVADLHALSGSHVYGVVGFNRLKIGWEPAGGEVLRAWYTPRPDPMSADEDDPVVPQYGNIPTEFHSVLIDYASWQLADSSGDTGSGRGESYRVRYEGKDGNASLGSGLGRIRFAINKRVSGGSPTHRLAASGGVISDGDLTYWQG